MSWDGVERRKHARYVISRDAIYNGCIIDIYASAKFVPYKVKMGSESDRGEKAVAVLRQRMT